MIEKLSNYIIKAYKKKSGKISFHFRSHLFIKTKGSFSIAKYLSNLESYFILPDGNKINFESLYVVAVPFLHFNGEYIVSEIYFTTVSDLTMVKPCIVDLQINYSFFGHPCIDPDEFKCAALIKFMY